MTEESASSGPSSAKKRRKSAPVPPDEFVGDRIKQLKTTITGFKHERVKLAQQRCWVLDMAFFLYPPQVASSKCMLRVMFLPEMQVYSGRPTLCRTCSCCSTWSLHGDGSTHHEARLRYLHPASQQAAGSREEKDYTCWGSGGPGYGWNGALAPSQEKNDLQNRDRNFSKFSYSTLFFQPRSDTFVIWMRWRKLKSCD